MNQFTPAFASGSTMDIGRTVKVIDEAQLHKARHAGRKAKIDGFARISPYYDCPPLDHYWFAGYDGKTWEQAVGT